MALVIILFIVNFLISAFNAWSVGRGWAESKAAGGFARFMSWCGAIMSASGFTWCYTIVLAYLFHQLPGKYHLPDKYFIGMLDLGYLVVIVPIIGSGIAITVQSWMYFWRERTFVGGAVAGWNTFADIYNIYEATQAIPESLSFLSGLFEGKDDDEDKNFLLSLMIALVALSVIGGIVTTTLIIRTVVKNEALEQGLRAERARRDNTKLASN